MATIPHPGAATPQLPLFYKKIVPLSGERHGALGIAERNTLPFARGQNIVPVTVDEFAVAQRYMPIVFSAGENPFPLALLGLHEGENHFADADGKWREGAYVPAYLRRYPFLLGRLRPESNDLTLCFDEESDDMSEDSPRKLFENGAPSETTKAIMGFCERFEQAAQRTRAFTDELLKLELLMDGEASVRPLGQEKPSLYRGFKMVNEEKLKELRGDQVRKLVQKGALPLIYAHLLSISLIRDLYLRSNPSAAFSPQPPVTAEA